MTSDPFSNWLPVHATLLEWQRISRSLRELQVSFQCDAESGAQSGDSLWGTPSHGALVALAWRWREVAVDVVAIENPMDISSNVVLVDEEGRELAATKRILQLNNAVYRLRWQSRVLAGARSRRAPLAA